MTTLALGRLPGGPRRWSIVGLAALLLGPASGGRAQETDPLAEVRGLRLRGDLVEARAVAEREPGRPPGDLARQIELRLELARIHDRIGLHENTHPAEAALAEIEAAAAVAERAGPSEPAAIEPAIARRRASPSRRRSTSRSRSATDRSRARPGRPSEGSVTARLVEAGLLVGAVAMSCRGSVSGAGDRDADRIRALDEGWKAAAARRVLDGMLAIYAPDAVEFLPGMPAVEGRDRIRELYRQLIEEQFTADTLRPDEAQNGKFVGVWRKANGDGRLAINISSADGSGPGP